MRWWGLHGPHRHLEMERILQEDCKRRGKLKIYRGGKEKDTRKSTSGEGEEFKRLNRMHRRIVRKGKWDGKDDQQSNK